MDLKRFVCICGFAANRGSASVPTCRPTCHRQVGFYGSNLFLHRKIVTPRWDVTIFGGPEEIRTLDPYNANVVRSQLRYRPICLPLYYSILLKKIQPFFSFSRLFFCRFYRGLTRISEWTTIKADVLSSESRFHKKHRYEPQNRRCHRPGLFHARRARHSDPQGIGYLFGS